METPTSPYVPGNNDLEIVAIGPKISFLVTPVKFCWNLVGSKLLSICADKIYL